MHEGIKAIRMFFASLAPLTLQALVTCYVRGNVLLQTIPQIWAWLHRRTSQGDETPSICYSYTRSLLSIAQERTPWCHDWRHCTL